MKLKIGAIGYRNHAKRIIDIFAKNKKVTVDKIYYPKKIKGDKYTSNLNSLVDCDIILILSPKFIE